MPRSSNKFIIGPRSFFSAEARGTGETGETMRLVRQVRHVRCSWEKSQGQARISLFEERGTYKRFMF